MKTTKNETRIKGQKNRKKMKLNEINMQNKRFKQTSEVKHRQFTQNKHNSPRVTSGNQKCNMNKFIHSRPNITRTLNQSLIDNDKVKSKNSIQSQGKETVQSV